MLKMMKMFLGSLKIYGRLSLTIRFVHDHPGAVLGVDKNNRWYNRWQSMIRDAN